MWRHVDANGVPPSPKPEYIAAFKAYFTNDATNEQLIQGLNHGPELIDSSLVCIGISISLATRKKIANDIKLVEKFILEYIHSCIAKFGLVHWCPDFNQTAYSVYNSACCLITLNTFKQVLICYAYDYLSPVTHYAQDMIFMTKLYDHFVHYCMYQIFKMECRHPESVQEMSETNPQYQNYK